MRHPARVTDLLNPASVLLPAANVIMQLAAPGVGYGVVESPVDRGNVYKHPFKRARTTGTYLAAATIGTDADRALIRKAVNGAHAQVRTRPSSPMSYNAFDPDLQLWVAACLYRYYLDAHEFLYGPLDDAAADAVYRDAARLGTTLQVRPEAWPADRAAFDEYWKRSLDTLAIDEPVREHLTGVAALSFLPWTAEQARRFEWLLTALRLVDRIVPRQAWVGAYRIYLLDMRTRARLGLPIV